MTMPRSKYVREGEEGFYHCFNRCVRRAFLYGFDPVTHRDYSHRKVWIVDRLRFLADIFAIDVCAYAVLANHYHSILRLRPDIVAAWSDREVAIRWLRLYPPHDGPPTEIDITLLLVCPERITKLRRRLCSISWFMGRLNEFIARAANKEDDVKGRFWESRFKCQALLDEIAIIAGMVYVDLNPIRAGIAATPEDSDFTSIQERIRAWHRGTVHTAAAIATGASEPSIPASCWLCPIQSDSRRRGILQMTDTEYFDLVDKSGRLLRSDKRGSIDPDLVPILLRIGANPQAWQDTISRFGSRFRLAAGLISSLRSFASQLNQKWLSGVTSARDSFASAPPQLA